MEAADGGSGGGGDVDFGLWRLMLVRIGTGFKGVVIFVLRISRTACEWGEGKSLSACPDRSENGVAEKENSTCCVYMCMYIYSFFSSVGSRRGEFHPTPCIGHVLSTKSSHSPPLPRPFFCLLFSYFSETEFICWHEPYFGPKLPLESQ